MKQFDSNLMLLAKVGKPVVISASAFFVCSFALWGGLKWVGLEWIQRLMLVSSIVVGLIASPHYWCGPTMSGFHQHW